MTAEKPLAGKLALVTGASRGIGAATAEALGSRGAHVILVARGQQALEAVEERIHQAGGSATIAPLDLTDGEALARLGAAVAERWDRLECLVLNAGLLGALSPVEHIDPKEFNRVLATNLLANQALIAAFDPMLRRAERADIVALTSSVGREPRAFWGAYGASKAALETLCLAYAQETEHAGRIRVHIVDPGATRTLMRQNAFPGEEPDNVKPPEVVAEAIVARLQADVPTGERVRVEE